MITNFAPPENAIERRYALRSVQQRLRVLARAGALVTVLAVLAGLGFLYQQRQTQEARRLAGENRRLAAQLAGRRVAVEVIDRRLDVEVKWTGTDAIDEAPDRPTREMAKWETERWDQEREDQAAEAEGA